MFTLLAILGFLALLPAVAWRWGADTRDGYDWHTASAVPVRHGPVHLPEAWVDRTV
jgi:hypothetical protein